MDLIKSYESSDTAVDDDDVPILPNTSINISNANSPVPFTSYFNGESLDTVVEELDDSELNRWADEIDIENGRYSLPTGHGDNMPGPSRDVSLHVEHSPRGYVSTDEEEIPATPINVEYEELQEHKIRSVYLVTYSQADVERFNRRTFADAVVESFNSGQTMGTNGYQWAPSNNGYVVWKVMKMEVTIFTWHFF